MLLPGRGASGAAGPEVRAVPGVMPRRDERGSGRVTSVRRHRAVVPQWPCVSYRCGLLCREQSMFRLLLFGIRGMNSENKKVVRTME